MKRLLGMMCKPKEANVVIHSDNGAVCETDPSEEIISVIFEEVGHCFTRNDPAET